MTTPPTQRARNTPSRPVRASVMQSFISRSFWRMCRDAWRVMQAHCALSQIQQPLGCASGRQDLKRRENATSDKCSFQGSRTQILRKLPEPLVSSPTLEGEPLLRTGAVKGLASGRSFSNNCRNGQRRKAGKRICDGTRVQRYEGPPAEDSGAEGCGAVQGRKHVASTSPASPSVTFPLPAHMTRPSRALQECLNERNGSRLTCSNS
ncbi:hypothetical protein EDF62_0012 [Leucobacter luti]|uniref:Uncharacterized protein n=1 Tax=Leucobacter luti TaxID=340320 RepID=A0A4R6S7T9_9MICO|nr:hypothetical protein EDF62_0012 [Leucobacter luti]